MDEQPDVIMKKSGAREERKHLRGFQKLRQQATEE
jgi:hypothetical protein